MAHRCGVLYAPENVPDVCKGPQGYVGHLEAALIVDIAVSVHLVQLVVHQGFGDQTVHPRHVRRRESS